MIMTFTITPMSDAQKWGTLLGSQREAHGLPVDIAVSVDPSNHQTPNRPRSPRCDRG
jgi:hypothetical protein